MAVVHVAQWLQMPAAAPLMANMASEEIAAELESHVNDVYVRSIPRRHPRIFSRNKRQSDGDLGWMASAASNAFKLYSLVSSVMGGPKPAAKDPNRIDTDVKEEATVTKETENKKDDGLDEALGTLMAYGGQYLRKMALWGWEMATATPSEKIGDGPIDLSPSTSTSTLSSSLSSLASVSVSNPLKRLSSAELEKLGLKAVQNGADPTQLQQAFATAQLDGNWKPLEKLIVKALGSQAVYGNNKPSTTTFGTTSSVAVPAGAAGAAGPGGLSYVKLKAQEVMQKLNRVVNGYPQGTKPAYPGVQDTMLLRFVKEFQLEKEALAMQDTLNSAIFTFNNMFGGQPSASDKIDAADTNSDSPGILTSILSLPKKLMALITGAASAKPDKPIKKVDASGATYSEVQAVSPVGSLAAGAIGTTVVGGALYYLYNSYLEDEKRRSSDIGTLNRRVDEHDVLANNKFYDNQFGTDPNQRYYANNDLETHFYDSSWDSQNEYFQGNNDYYTQDEGYGENYYDSNGYNNLNNNNDNSAGQENFVNRGDTYGPYYSAQTQETKDNNQNNNFYGNNENNEFYGNNENNEFYDENTYNLGDVERSGHIDNFGTGATSFSETKDVVDQHGGGGGGRRRRRSPW